jgi:putative transposase
MYALLHGNKNLSRKRKITDLEGQVLLSILLHPNKVSIGSAITMLKAQARMGHFESPASKPTLRRWCEDWRDDNRAIWEQTRRGSKYVAEHIIKTIQRDSSLLKVGDVWVADGHTLAFDILNPKTGKAQRMTMIMVLDWASRYPVGAALAFTEDSHHIQVAFRNGFLNWGALPRCVYLDNGKAFRSKLFHEQWDHHDLELELGGIFPKLGIEAHFAESYNAKAKVIERFFKTFQEQFERFISSFRGSCIADKPATLMRNEKWAKKLFEAHPPTIEEAMQMIGYYVRYIYGDNEHGGLNGKTPWQVFSSAQLPPARLVQPDKLNFMMLAAERKAVRNDGIVFNKLLYWHPALLQHIGKSIVFRYDYADARWILVYDHKDNFICQAELRRTQHPFIHLDKDDTVSHKELNIEYKQIKKLQRMTEQQSKLFVKKNQESVDRVLGSLSQISATIDNPTFKQPAMLIAPKPGPEEEIARLEEIVTSQSVEPGPEPELKPIVTQRDAASGADQQFNPFEDESFKEMLKTIGIK